MKKIIISLVIGIAIGGTTLVYGAAVKPTQLVKLGSVTQGSSYKAFVTAPAQANLSFHQSSIISSVPGVLGSVIITGAGAGYFTLYDATTSDATKRTLTATTSLSILAQFPVNAAANTYTFDVDYFNGLVLEFTGAVATSTITYRY